MRRRGSVCARPPPSPYCGAVLAFFSFLPVRNEEARGLRGR